MSRRIPPGFMPSTASSTAGIASFPFIVNLYNSLSAPCPNEPPFACKSRSKSFYYWQRMASQISRPFQPHKNFQSHKNWAQKSIFPWQNAVCDGNAAVQIMWLTSCFMQCESAGALLYMLSKTVICCIGIRNASKGWGSSSKTSKCYN